MKSKLLAKMVLWAGVLPTFAAMLPPKMIKPITPPGSGTCDSGFTSQIQALNVSASDSKVGFTCGSGCNKRYFKVENASSSTKWKYTSEGGPAYMWDNINANRTVANSSSGRYINIVETGPCSRTVTTNTHTSGNIETEQQDMFSYYSNAGYSSSSCRYMTVDGSVVYYKVNGQDASGPADCWELPTEIPGSPISTKTETFPCGPSRTTEEYRWSVGTGADSIKRTLKIVSYSGTGMVDEYTLSDCIDRATACAKSQLLASFGTCSTCQKTAIASAVIGSEKQSADIGLSKWRVRITGFDPKKKYMISLNWLINKNGKYTQKTEIIGKQTPSGSTVWYYPNEQGETLKPEVKEECGYVYSKILTSASVDEDRSSIWDGPPLSGNGSGGGDGGGGAGCQSCSGYGGYYDPITGAFVTGAVGGGGDYAPPQGSPGVAPRVDPLKIFSIRLGSGTANGDLGSLEVTAGENSPTLASVGGLQYTGREFSEAEILRSPSRITQVSTPRAFINISETSDTSYTVRVMEKAAQSSMDSGNVAYTFDNSPSYLIREIQVDNPDAGTADNRMRIREVTPSSTNEWMYTYTATNSGWNVTLPDGSGSIDTTTTNQNSTAFTLMRRYRNSTGAIIAQFSQIYTNFDWGTALLEETSGIGSDARTTKMSYWTGATNEAPFEPKDKRLPIKSVESPDGSWRYYPQYTTAGLVKTELHGIDCALTTNTNLCLRIEYTYASQDTMVDDLSRQPEQPRKIEEWWKGTLIKRTYHIYTATMHKVIECPNPNNSISDSSNLITETHNDGTSMVITKIVLPDSTIQTYSYSTAGDPPIETETVDVGQNNGSGAVSNGTRTKTETDEAGTVQSIKSWDLVSGAPGVQIRNSVWSNFDDLGRPQQLTELGSLTTTFSYDCCGMGSVTDPDGTVTTYGYDALHRNNIVSKWGIATLSIFDAAGRVIQQQRIGTNNTTIVLSTQGYDTAGFLTVQTNALGGTNTFIRSKLGSGFDQILSGNPDGGTNAQTFLADGRQDKLTGNSTAPVRHAYGVATGVSYLGGSRTFEYEQTIKLDDTGADTSETEKTYFDGLGRVVIRELPGPAQYVTEYDSLGRKVRDIDPDGVWTLYRYDAKGELIVTAVDVDHDQAVDDYDAGQSGSDRVTKNISYYVAAGSNPRGVDLRIDEQSVWTTASAATTALVSKTETKTDGLKSWRSLYKDQTPTLVTTTTETVYAGSGSRTETTTAASGVKQITTYSYGRAITLTEKDSANAQITKTDIYYDPHGRRLQTTDARNGATTFGYNNADQITSVTTPVPGNGQPAQTTATTYDVSMRATLVTHPDGRNVTNEYNTLGLLKKTYGARTYPVEYTYDPQGRIRTMKTWQDFAGNANAAITTWSNSPTRGWLIWKHYNDGNGPDYTYTPGGRLQTRTWARTGTGGNRIVTTYSYGLASGSWHGDQTGIAYSNDPQSTPAVTYTYDRRGRHASVSSSIGGVYTDAITYSYNDAGIITQDSHTAGILTNLNVTWGYNGSLQLTSLGANTPTTISQSFTYKNSGLLDVATDGAYSATYSYAANSKLVSQILFKNNTTTRLTTTKQWDFLNRLTETKSTPQSTTELPSVFRYGYNDANQRISCTMGDGSYWIYQYDNLGQVISGKRFWGDGTPVAGQQFEYGFDDIGNRKSTKSGGDGVGQNLQPATYTPNLLNQYSQRMVPGVVSVLGIANPNATVTVNSSSAYRKGEYFWKETSVSNGSGPVWQIQNIAASNGSSTTDSRTNFVAQTPEGFSYDLDGNLTQDGRWNYTWDAENRLIRMVAATANGPQQRLDFIYDPIGRRIRKQVWNNTAGTGTAALDIKFLYEGWNLITEMDGSNSNAILRTYLWATDMSGSRDGGSGVGGLLGEKNSSGVSHFVVFDGNGNLTRLVDGSTGTTSATYEFGPFGQNIRANGSYAASNPIRSSTKYRDAEADLLYYGYRYYATDVGRWLSRDPLDSDGSKNLFAFVENDSIGSVDILGLWRVENDFGQPQSAQKIGDKFLGSWLLNLNSKIDRTSISVHATALQTFLLFTTTAKADASVNFSCDQNGYIRANTVSTKRLDNKGNVSAAVEITVTGANAQSHSAVATYYMAAGYKTVLTIKTGDIQIAPPERGIGLGESAGWKCVCDDVTFR